MQLVIKEIIPATIQSNIQELDLYMEETKNKYLGLVFQEEDIKKAKEERATLNKIEKNLAEVRKDVTKRGMSQIDEFINKLKVSEKEIKELSKSIDEQIKAVEEKEQQLKLKQVTEIKNRIFEQKDLEGHLVFNEKWKNKTCKIKEIEEEIKAQYEKLIETKKFIMDQLEKYNKDLMTVITYEEVKHLIIKDYPTILNEIENKISERKTLEESIKQRAEEQAKRELEEKQIQEQQQEIKEEIKVEKVEIKEVENEKTWNMVLVLNDIPTSKAKALKEFMQVNQINYELKGE